MLVGKKDDRNVVVKPESRIDISNAHEFKTQLLALLEEGYNYLTVDFSRVKKFDSAGLGKLLFLQKKAKEKGGELRIINVTSEQIRNFFQLIHLHRVINIEGQSKEQPLRSGQV